MVTSPGVPGQVKTGFCAAALSKVPAVAVHANIGATAPAVAVADRAMGALRAASSGAADIEVMPAQTTVVPLTSTLPELPVPGSQLSVTGTPVVVFAVIANGEEPA